MKEITAFETYLVGISGGKVAQMAHYLYKMVQQHPGSDNQVWAMLAKTGDKEYTLNSFLKVSRLILEKQKYKENE